MNRKLICLLGNIPTFIKHKRGESIIGVCASNTLRSLPFFKGLPYFNSTNIKFGLQVVLPKNKTFADIDYEWKLYTRENNKLIRSGQDVMKLSDVKVGRFRIKKNRDIDLVWGEKYVTFTKYEAIKIGHLSKFEQYDLRVSLKSIAISSEEITVAEFTLQDIDDLGLEYTNVILAAIFGVIGGVVSAIIYLALFGGGR